MSPAARRPETASAAHADLDSVPSLRTIVTSDAFSTLAYAAYDGLPANSTVPSWDEIEGLYGQVVEASEANLPTPTNINESIALANNEVGQMLCIYSINVARA